MKIYSNEYIKDFNKLKNSVIGFEFEFYTDMSYYKLLELLNKELSPIKTSGFRKYHSDFKPDENNFKLEPDLSGGPQLCEYITGPIPYTNSKLILLKILRIMDKYARTDEKCSLHINISFNDVGDGKILNNLNKLKILLGVDEDYIYNFFPERKNNIYAKSVKALIPFKEYDYSINAVDLIQNNIQLPDNRYFGINFQTSDKIDTVGQRLEWRYVGGSDYHKKTSDILNLMDYFIATTWNSCNSKLDDDDLVKLKEYLFENINLFKTFSNYDSFIAEFPSIDVQVDKISEYNVVKAYYDKMYDEIFEMFRNIYNLSDCIINIDTELNRIEVVGATFKAIFDIYDIDFIECTINNGRYNSCSLISSELINGSIHGGDVIDSIVINSKLEYSKIDTNSEIIDSYLYQCNIDGEIKGTSILRMCKLGPNAVIGDDVRISNDFNNYFNTKAEVGGKKGDDKMGIPEIKIPDTKGKKW